MNKALLKITLSQSFDFRKKDKKVNSSILIPLIIILIFGLLFSALYSYLFVAAIKSKDEYVNLIYSMAGIYSLVVITSNILRAKGTLFGGNDYDLLASLPIPKRSIIFSKIISLYIVQLFYSIIFILPSAIIAFIYSFNFIFLIIGLLVVIFTPIIPLFISAILGTFIGIISDRFKFSNILSIFFYIVFICIIMYISYTMNSGDNVENIAGMITVFSWFNPSTMLLKFDYSYSIILYCLINAVVVALMTFLFSLVYDDVHYLMISSKNNNSSIKIKENRNSEFKALLIFDFKRYFSSKMYLINTITGGLMSILSIIVIILSFKNNADPNANSILNDISCLFVLVIIWCSCMAVPSAVSINFEGKAMWQMKVLPINYKKYSLSKVLMSYLVLAPFVLISSIILLFFNNINLLNTVTIIFLPQLYLFSMSLIGYYINLRFYRLKWNNETEAVKNSSSMIISMLIDLVYTIILVLLFVVLFIFNYFYIGVIISFILVISLIIIFYILAMKKCDEAINSIEI